MVTNVIFICLESQLIYSTNFTFKPGNSLIIIPRKYTLT